eukprot:215117-Ditylum_brightwellii.AAC.1
MVTSSTKESVPPAGDVKPLAQEKSYAKAPVMPTIDNGLQEKLISQSRHNYRWRLTFPVPKNEDILPRRKFTTLLSMIGQFWPSTVLNTWSAEDLLQSLMDGKDLPYLQNDLVLYFPHVKRKTRLETMWNLSPETTLEKMKENRPFIKHLEVNRIFINMTMLMTVVQEVWVWCAILHPNQTCQDKAKAELNNQLSLVEDCKLNQYLVWASRNDAKLNTTQSLVVA